MTIFTSTIYHLKTIAFCVSRAQSQNIDLIFPNISLLDWRLGSGNQFASSTWGQRPTSSPSSYAVNSMDKQT